MGLTLSYDLLHNRCLLFGGTGEGTFADTWAWNGTYWTQLADTGPAGRLQHAAAYDSLRKRLVLFGGLDRGGELRGDTWEYDGRDWVQAAETGPAPRSSHCMAFDPATRKMLVFGGATASGTVADTWAWDGLTWTEVADTGPSPREGAVWAATGTTLVLHGGCAEPVGPKIPIFADTWQWMQGQWTQVQNLGPAARAYHGLVNDGLRQRLVLFGGTAGAAACGDTWDADSPASGVRVVSVTVSPTTVPRDGQVTLTISLSDDPRGVEVSSWIGSYQMTDHPLIELETISYTGSVHTTSLQVSQINERMATEWGVEWPGVRFWAGVGGQSEAHADLLIVE
ncbi:hypothetical protein P2Q00_50265 [Streptomyces coacervatus]|nr:kelch repeat-containing protein [Streptomyces coacervatus]MDF2273512.1 hypothetical protein [Streptomyces coacervatus]